MKNVNNKEALRKAEEYYDCGPRAAMVYSLSEEFSVIYEKGTFENYLLELSDDELVDTFNAYYPC